MQNSRNFPISIIIADIDGLKKINDSLGHRIGDKYIKQSAKIISSITRDEDVVARIGGDEFAALLPDTDAKTAGDFCERLTQKFKEHKKEDKYSKLSLSCGHATKNTHETSLEDTLNKADKDMNSVKHR